MATVRLLSIKSQLNIRDIGEKKIVSYCLYGQNHAYITGAIENATVIANMYPGWIARFYVGSDISTDVVNQLVNLNAEIIIMRSKGVEFRYTLWRYLAYDDENVKIVMFRDCDSLLTLREKQAVDQWLLSGKAIHLMRDHVCHNSRIMGGMFGLKKDIRLHKMRKKMVRHPKQSAYSADQSFLNHIIYPLFKGDAMIHDHYHLFKDEQVLDFPSPRINEDFVGSPVFRS